MSASATRSGGSPTPTPGGSAPARERWALAQSLLEEALAHGPDERAAYLVARCADPGLRAEVEALVAAHEAHGPLDALADGVMRPLLATGRPEDTPAPLPSVDTRYRVVARLGGGGMGVVYRARDERLARDVALKFLPAHLNADPAAKKRFLVEARAAAALEHPNICTVHEIGETGDGRLYIVMACYDGETLERRIARGALPVAEALRVAGEIARGLARAHERGIIHRDIKPANVVLTTDGMVKILDFGIAKLADAAGTQTAGAIGTLAYMSPEQAFGEVVDHRTDIWSLGVVLYEMLSGVRPFRGPGQQAILFSALTAEPEPLAGMGADVPASVDALLRRALAKQPADRFAGAGELLAALAACAAPIQAAGAEPAAATPACVERRDSTLSRGGERRQVTVVTCLVAGHDRLVERLSPDEAERVLTRVRDAAVEVATRHEGIVNHFLGDQLVMLFGVPAAHEDDALRGVRAALALHARVAALAAGLEGGLAAGMRLRTGVHVGAVVAQRQREGDRRFRVAGAAVDGAARLAAAAEPDAILASPEVRRLAGPFLCTAAAAPVALTAEGAPVTPGRVLGISDVRSRLEGAARAGLTPLVGRERERATLAEQLALARGGEGRVVVLVGEAGAGKSRLVHETRAAATAVGVRVLAGHCHAQGGAAPFLPFVEAAREALGLGSDDVSVARHDAVVAAVRAVDPSLEELLPLVLALLGIPSERHPVSPQLGGALFQTAMLDAIAALFTIGARSVPTLLVLEDWHWADEGSRAALRQLAEIVPPFPLLLVVTTRPEGAAGLGSADHQLLLHLPPLDDGASAALARAVLGVERVDAALVARLHERTGGNPFFLEEVCEGLREEGAVTVRGGVAVAADASGAVHVPETVQGVLRARIDRLDDAARDVLRTASVIGREFTRGILEDIAERSAELPGALERLRASGLVQQLGVVPEPAYRFKHALTQEVAYDSLLEHQRMTLHAAVGDAIERRHAARLDDQAERLAYHFGQAERWPEAVRWGLRAAERAAALSQNADALGTLERVEEWVRRLPDDAARRAVHAEVLLRQERLCEALGLRTRQLELVETLIGQLAPYGPSEHLAQVYLRQGDAFTLLRRFEAAERALATALQIARERGDDTGERHALRSITLLRSYEGRHEEALATIERVLALARAAGDARAEAGDLATLANILRAMGQPARALEVLQTALEGTPAVENPVRHGALLNVIGTVYRDLGDYDAALEYFGRRIAAGGVERRHPVNASFTLPAIAEIQLRQGRIEEALATYREAVELNRRTRHAEGGAHVCRSLGEVLVGLGRDGEAVPYLREAARLFAQLEDPSNEAATRQRLAATHERLGEAAEASEAWTRARALYAALGEAASEAAALEGMARVERRLAGPTDAALAHYDEALAITTRLGDGERELAIRNALGIVHWQRGAYPEAVRHYEAALRLCRERGDGVHEALILNSLGATLHRLRRWDEARATLAEGIRAAEAAGERRLRAHALATLGDVCLDGGRLDEARASVEASLALRRELADRRGEGWMLERLARVHAACGEPGPARTSAAEAAAIAGELGDDALREAVARLRIPSDPPTPSS